MPYTQSDLLDVESHTNYRTVRAYFKQRPGEWVSALDLERIGGRLSWRTRVSECRVIDHMTIENKQPVVDGVRRSLYRYVP